jgi:hypothetical protein
VLQQQPADSDSSDDGSIGRHQTVAHAAADNNPDEPEDPDQPKEVGLSRGDASDSRCALQTRWHSHARSLAKEASELRSQLRQCDMRSLSALKPGLGYDFEDLMQVRAPSSFRLR